MAVVMFAAEKSWKYFIQAPPNYNPPSGGILQKLKTCPPDIAIHLDFNHGSQELLTLYILTETAICFGYNLFHLMTLLHRRRPTAADKHSIFSQPNSQMFQQCSNNAIVRENKCEAPFDCILNVSLVQVETELASLNPSNFHPAMFEHSHQKLCQFYFFSDLRFIKYNLVFVPKSSPSPP